MYKFLLIYDASGIDVSTNLRYCEYCDDKRYYYQEKYEQQELWEEVLKHNKGVAIEENQDEVRISNDLFCSIPLYVYKQCGKIVVTSDYCSIDKKDLNVDLIALYETLLYDSPLYDRTIFQEIKYLPAASSIVIAKKTSDYSICNYWNYMIPQMKRKISEKEAVEKIWNKLCLIMKAYQGRDLLMGVSGGLDSRLSLCALDSVLDIRTLSAFTFGHNRRVKDYRIAKTVCSKLSKPIEPLFVKLTGESYLQALDLPCKSGGDVGINHSHILWCLKNVPTTGRTLISNYYSDAIMGYDCVPIDYDDVIENCAYFKKLKQNDLLLSKNINEAIEKDIRKIANRYDKKSNFSCLDEFIYLVERNPRFHMRLSYIYSEYIEVVSPYAEYELLEMVLSLPQKYRYRKRIEQMILKNRLNYDIDISSTRYSGLERTTETIWGKAYYNMGYIIMRGINVVNAGLSQLTGGNFQISNPYITENHLQIFNQYFIKYYIEAYSQLLDRGYISKELSEVLAKPCVRTFQAQRGFSIIGLKSILFEGD